MMLSSLKSRTILSDQVQRVKKNESLGVCRGLVPGPPRMASLQTVRLLGEKLMFV
jgi:hypothetical protein